MLGKGFSVDLLHLDHDIFNRFGYQVHKGTISSPVSRVSKTLDDCCGQKDYHLLLL